MASTSDFTSRIVSIVIAVVVVAAIAVPITSNLVTEEMDPTLATVIKIIPVFLVLAVLMMVVKMFMGGRKE